MSTLIPTASLDEQVAAALERVRAVVSGQLEAEFSASRDEILRVAGEQRARAAAEAAEAALATARRETADQLTALRQAQGRESEEARRRLDEALQANATLGGQLDRARLDLEVARGTSEGARQELADTQRELAEARRGLDDVGRELGEAQRGLAETRRELDDLRGELGDVRRDLTQVRCELTGTQRELGDTRHQRDEAVGQQARAARALEEADELPAALRVLDEATTLGAVLDELVCLASREAGRGTVFLVKADKLYEWRSMGFDPDDLRPGLTVASEEPSLIGEAVRSGGICEHRAGEGSPLPAFATGEDQRRAVALPVVVGGSVIAVLYADKLVEDEAEPPRWPIALDVAVRYAGRVLEGLTIRRAAALWGTRPSREQPAGAQRP